MDSMSASMMSMTFFTSHTTPLYSEQWTPKSTGAYAGTCIFIILLAALYRGSFKFLHLLEMRWLESSLNRRYIVVADKTPIAERISNVDSKTAVISANGVEENVRIAQAPMLHVQPWRFSVDLPRAAVYTVIAGIGYLL